jgi:hypothetical protein
MRKLKMARRGIVLGAVLGVFMMLSGDPRAQSSAANWGIDPLEVLQVQVKNNVLFVFDTSGSMRWPVDFDDTSLGGDAVDSRLYKGKQAVATVVRSNRTRMNFGLASYNVLTDQKVLNPSGGEDNDGNGKREVFVYISADAPAAPFYVDAYCPSTADTRDGFFCSGDNLFANLDGTTSSEVWRSFNNRRGTRTRGIHDVYTDPVTGVNHYYLHSNIFRGNTRFTWNLANTTEAGRLVSQTAITCPNPPAGLVGWTTDTEAPDNDGDGVGDGNGVSDQAVPCIEMADNSTGAVARYYYTSAVFNNTVGGDCNGAAILSEVAFCTGDNADAVLSHMRAELPIVDVLNLQGVGPAVQANNSPAATDRRNTNPTPSAGVRADQATPIYGSLTRIRTGAAVFPVKPAAVARIQKNFVVFITDGDDTCAPAGDQDGDGTSNTNDDRAIYAGQEASRLYYEGCGLGNFTCVMDGLSTTPRLQAETFFIAFASAVNIARSNNIARGGSGAVWNAGSRSFQCPAPAADGRVPPCRDAFQASTTEQLIIALEQAMQAATASGEFSATQGSLGTVFELGDLGSGPPEDRYPLLATDPLKRYDVRVNLFFQSTFKFPNWEGHLYAYANDGNFSRIPSGINFTNNWDAGETLYEQIAEGDLGIASNNVFTFDQLKTTLRRRIFTSIGNGTWTRSNLNDFNQANNTNVVSLWPPDATTLSPGVDTTGFFAGTIDPPVPAGGPIDAALGIDLLTYAELQAQLDACEATAAGVAPPACDSATGDASLNPALALATAKKEARQIILAYSAGAQVALDTGRVQRGPGPDYSLLFKARGNPGSIPPSILADTQLSQPAVVTPPLRSVPTVHTPEFLLFRDGPRGVTRSGSSQGDAQTHFNLGFGLRNPDSDTSDQPGTAGAETTRFNAVLKPRMTVIYVGASDGLHAFSAETSEELWTFAPFDQLSKLRLLASSGQTHSPHTYSVSSSVRVADIFVPTASYQIETGANAITYSGLWRTVAFFGRGPGGKYYTALDITSPAQFTISRGGSQLDTIVGRQVLNTNPPWVMWNRGNPDLKVDGTPVRSADTTAYAKMGESWSVPAVGNVDPTVAAGVAPPGGPGGPEWRAYVGSGYSGTPGEGSTFYELDAITGNINRSWDVGQGNTTWVPRNALVASPAGYNSFQLDPPNTTVPGPDVVTRLYIPDVHGRIWKFTTTSGGAFANGSNGIGPPEYEQPFGDAVSLLKLNNKAYVFANSGRDRRVRPAPSPAPPFKMFGYRDDAPDELTFNIPGVKLFEESFLSPFRAAGQPATGFNSVGAGRVFFLGTRLNTANANCLSSFDSILFALGAQTGVGVYDFDGATGADKSILFLGERMMGPGVGGKQIMLTTSGRIDASGTQVPPTPPSPRRPIPRAEGKTLADVKATSQTPSSTVCRF